MQKGYIAILTVLIISAVVLIIATTVSLLAIGEAQSAFALFKGEDTITFVEGCMEDALLKARNNNSYTSGSITRPEGTCTITISKAGTTWTVMATTTNTQYARTVQAVITRGSQMAITSWKEL
ncbi:MAG TPA: hypothetical protein VLG12_02160 [Candidatus Saccharimonadales bacterium]|nr:hypothetical protein [Candidatus Saccharimonadales bacterium]